MSFQPVLLWSDLCIWLLVLGGRPRRLGVVAAAAAARRLVAGRRSRPGMAAATLLVFFALAGLLGFAALPTAAATGGRREGGGCGGCGEQGSLFGGGAVGTDVVLTSRARRSRRLYWRRWRPAPTPGRDEQRQPDGSLRTLRDYPRLKYGGAALGVTRRAWRAMCCCAVCARCSAAVAYLSAAAGHASWRRPGQPVGGRRGAASGAATPGSRERRARHAGGGAAGGGADCRPGRRVSRSAPTGRGMCSPGCFSSVRTALVDRPGDDAGDAAARRIPRYRRRLFFAAGSMT